VEVGRWDVRACALCVCGCAVHGAVLCGASSIFSMVASAFGERGLSAWAEIEGLSACADFGVQAVEICDSDALEI
jgi:hypothetical protein